MSGKKWTRVWLNPNRPIACWPVESKVLSHAEFMQVEEHQAILSEEHRLNAMGQERELALMARVKELEKRLLVAKEALKFYSRTGGASDTNDRKGCWILARRFIFGEAVAHDFEKIPYGETGTEYLLAGKRAREAIAAIEKEGR